MDEKTYEDFQKKWAKVIAKCWMDPSFKKNLMKNTEQALKEFGIEAPKNMRFEIEENTDKVIYLVIPQKPAGEISEELLKKVAGGFPCSCRTNFCM